MLANMGQDEKYGADDSAEKIAADIKNALPTSDVDLEKMGGDMLANLGQDKKYSDTKEDPTARIKSEMQTESINKAKATKFSDISVDASGMPVIRSKAEGLKKTEPKKEDTSSDDAETAKFKRQAEAKKAEEEKKKSEGGKTGETKSLDDVVKTLEKLNTTMNTLIKKTEEASANQVKATKSMASGNLFGAHA
jgi:hypothetical protein